MFNLAIDSKLRGCDLVSLRGRDVMHADQVLFRAMVVQRNTTTGAIRADRAYQVRRLSMDHSSEPEGGGLSVPQSPGEISTYLHAPVRTGRTSVDHSHRT